MDRTHTGHALRIAIGITMVVLLFNGGANAQTIISSCTTISIPGEYVLNQSISNGDTSTCIRINSSDVSFDGYGYTIENKFSINNWIYGIYVENYSNIISNVTILNVTVINWKKGIYFFGTTNGGIFNTTHNSNDAGIYIDSFSHKHTLRNNIVFGNNNGITIINSNENILDNNTVTTARYGTGISLINSSNSTIIDNKASNLDRGIFLSMSNNNELISNNFSNNQIGIYLGWHLNSTPPLSSNNNNNITRNIIISNIGSGIMLSNSSTNTIYDNYFNNSDNSETLNAWDNGNNNWNITRQIGSNIIGGLNLGGNFWSDYTGNDTYGDNLGDTLIPYNSSGNILYGGDYLPLVGNNTPPGSNIEAKPHPNISINFEEVLDGGSTTVNVTTDNPGPEKTSFRFLQTFYDIFTTAAYTGNVTVCLSYDASQINGEEEKNLHIFHHVGDHWDIVTQEGYPDTVNHIICGRVTSFSWFGIALPIGVHNVNKSTNYSTIQAAIDDANTSDEIHVNGGTYYENVNVNKQLILRGFGMTVVDANGSGSAITLSADGIILENFTATGALSYPEAGIKAYSSNNTLNGNNVFNNKYGIDLFFSSKNTLSGNNVSNNLNGIVIYDGENKLSGNILLNNTYGIWVWGGNGDHTFSNNYLSKNVMGIKLSGSNNIVDNNTVLQSSSKAIEWIYGENNTITNNNISLNGGGIFIWNSSNNTVIGNTFLNNSGLAIFMQYSDNNKLTCNTILYNGAGIDLDGSNNNILLDNIASNSKDFNGIGLRYSSLNNTLIDNIVSNNKYEGVNLLLSNNNTLIGNIVLNNINGLWLQNSSDNIIYNNHFNNLVNNVYFTGTNRNTWNISKIAGTNIIGGSYLGGNLWKNLSGTGFSQTCADTDKDSICDSNYALASGNVDYLPLVIPTGYINGTVLNNTDGIADVIVTTHTNISTKTNSSGFYSLLIPFGDYNLTVTKEPQYYPNSSVKVTVISESTEMQDIEILRKPTGNIGGTITKHY